MAEAGARQALEALAVDHHEAHSSMTPPQRALRGRLRAHGRQLGDVRDARQGTQSIDQLVREIAYEHWHRMLFARFLAENHLLIEPEFGVAITMQECEELARARGNDPWALAASFAQGMLPRIFRRDDPALEVALPPETRQALQKLLAELPAAVFMAADSLGWTYQFWQSARKKMVNERAKSGEKITGETLPAVTQLFTEPYMVQFLLHNTVGAWYASKVLTEELRQNARSEQPLRDAVRLAAGNGYDFDYLRFVREPKEGDTDENPTGAWRPAAGVFDNWPRTAKELTVLDPCCGSGHFVVAALELLVRLRMQEEGLGVRDAVRAVIADNLFALELDPRCTQIAAFNLALAAWKLVGLPIELPSIRIACSGIGPRASREEWLRIAELAAASAGMHMARDLFGGKDNLLSAGVRGGLEALYDLFDKAPELGSLIDPSRDSQLDALRAEFAAIEPLLGRILERERLGEEEVERAVAAKGMAEAARILIAPSAGYTLVITNVPYLGRASHSDWFKYWAETHFNVAKNDLATIFVARMLQWVARRKARGTVAAVTPQNWLFLKSYNKFRERLLKGTTWEMVARLGPGAFETITGHVVNVALIIVSGQRAEPEHHLAGLDVTEIRAPGDKAALLGGRIGDPKYSSDVGSTPNSFNEVDRNAATGPSDAFNDYSRSSIHLVPQAEQLKIADARITFVRQQSTTLLEYYADSYWGQGTGDYPRFVRRFWEAELGHEWAPLQGSQRDVAPFGGRQNIVLWERGDPTLLRVAEELREIEGHSGIRPTRGDEAWGKEGLCVTLMSSLLVARFTGEIFDGNCAAIIPKKVEHLPAIWEFCSSSHFARAVRQIDQKLNVVNRTLVKVPFELDHWQQVAVQKYPNGLPEPYSDDPTQWLFHGYPPFAVAGTGLQTAVARLLGYRWPAELDENMRLSSEAGGLVQRSRELDAQGFADRDGIVCLMPLRGEPSAAHRLRGLLAAAYGAEWSAAKERELLASAAKASHGNGRSATTLAAWLSTSFFEEHCKLLHHRPFIWHVWDGLENGFHALVNCHKLVGSDGVGRRTLDALTFTYLGEWIDRQRAAQKAGEEGADARLVAALRLQEELRNILHGEPPYDIFVRWKALDEQPVGWEPDINDGVRLNIRPFLMAADAGRKGAGVLRWKPNVKWGKDRGKEPESLRPANRFPWFWGCNPEKHGAHEIDFGTGVRGTGAASETFDGVRWNSLHYTRAAKEAARERACAERRA